MRSTPVEQIAYWAGHTIYVPNRMDCVTRDLSFGDVAVGYQSFFSEFSLVVSGRGATRFMWGGGIYRVCSLRMVRRVGDFHLWKFTSKYSYPRRHMDFLHLRNYRMLYGDLLRKAEITISQRVILVREFRIPDVSHGHVIVVRPFARFRRVDSFISP